MPIDIHYNKLLDWLQSRRHCTSSWQQPAVSIREKINNAIQDMPPVEEIRLLLEGSYINYFHCQRIVELLKQTDDGAKKNIFGQYSSQRLKDWLEIIKQYEKEGIYLAEAAQMLARSVNYEIPDLKRQLAKCQQLHQEYTRKEVDYAKMSEEFAEKFRADCRKMGIEGKNIKRELFSLAKCLPQTFEEIARESRNLIPAVDFYTGFVAFILNKTDDDPNCLRMVRYIMEKGNTTVYELHNGRPPLKILETPLDLEGLDENEEKEKEDEIDWGNIDVDTGLAEGNVSAGIVLEEESIENEIDWEVVDPLASGIDIEVVKDDSSPEPDGPQNAAGTEALTVLDYIETRNAFVDELYELETFLRQRLLELSGTGNAVISNAVFQSAPQAIQLDRENVTVLLNGVSALLGKLTASKMVDLLLIRSFPRYVDRLVENLVKLTSESEKMTSLSRLMVLKQEEVLGEQRRQEPMLKLMREKMKELQKQLEAEISVRYKNRRVNIMGDINTV